MRDEHETQPLAIRVMRPQDLPAVSRVAARDGLPVPPGSILVAEVDGEIRAAISLNTGELVADPFKRTEGLAELLRIAARPARDRARTLPLLRRPVALRARWRTSRA